MADQPLLNTYGRLPIIFDHGQGPWLFDTEGHRYFDTFSGIAVSELGHSHPAVSKAIQIQSERLLRCWVNDRLLPALTLTDAEAEFIVERVVRIIKLYAGDDHQRPRTPPPPEGRRGTSH